MVGARVCATDIYAFFSEGAIFSMCYKCNVIWMETI